MKSRLVPGGTLREFVIRTQLIRDESEQQDARAQAASPHPLPAHLVVRIASRYCTSSIPPTAESRFCVEINLESLWGVPLLAMGSGACLLLNVMYTFVKEITFVVVVVMKKGLKSKHV